MNRIVTPSKPAAKRKLRLPLLPVSLGATGALAALKLTGAASIPWLAVFAPLAIVLVLFLFAAALVGLATVWLGQLPQPVRK